jgi:hypothetical protein
VGVLQLAVQALELDLRALAAADLVAIQVRVTYVAIGPRTL